GRLLRRRGGRLQQPKLLAGAGRAAKRGGRERRQRAVETAAARGSGEQRRDLRRVFALAGLAAAEGRIREPPAARVADARENARAALGVMLREPAIEERVDGLRQPQQHPRGAPGPGGARRGEDAR